VTEGKPTELAAYQHVDGVLQRVPVDGIDPLRGRVYFAPPEADHDQGYAPVHVCPACTGGWHGQQCQQEFWTTEEPPALVDCDCTEGACRGEWVEVGYTTGHQLAGAGNLVLPAGARVFTAPVGTPPPGPDRMRGLVPRHVVLDEPAAMDRIGPPIPVRRTENRADGSYVEVSIGPAHPAYAAIRDGLMGSLSIGQGPVEKSADTEPYVGLDPVPGVPPTPPPAVTVASPPVNGLGREHIDRRRHIPKPQAIGLGDVVAALFGAELTGDPDEPVREVTRVVPNRADRRRAMRQSRRGH
jgi:hypothetical protein